MDKDGTQALFCDLSQDENPTKLIPLTQGKFATVDAEDYDWLSQYKWFAMKDKTRFYAGRKNKRTCRTVRMHQMILHAAKDMMCDHKDHNGLNNRKSNLRLCTNAQNQQNKQKRPGCSSGYKSVGWHKLTDKWQAYIRFDGKQIHLGLFNGQMGAALAYDRKAEQLFGEFACLNFPQLIEFRKRLKKLIWAGTEDRRLDGKMRPERPEMRFLYKTPEPVVSVRDEVKSSSFLTCFGQKD